MHHNIKPVDILFFTHSMFLFQSASGIFGHLKDVVLSHIQQDPTPDMNPDTLNALSALMVAQAQETIYRKCASGEIFT